jgi:hypothetical protein
MSILQYFRYLQRQAFSNQFALPVGMWPSQNAHVTKTQERAPLVSTTPQTAMTATVVTCHLI